MKIETNKISALQFMFSVACFLQASALLTAFFAPITKQDSWLVVCFGFIFCLPLIWIYIRLMQNFPDMNLFEIHDTVYGPVAGKIISVLYLWFFLTLTSLNLRDVGDFLKQTIMVETPGIVLLIAFVLTCAWAVHHGLKVVTRYSSFFVFVALTLMAVATILTISLMKMENFLPMLDLQPMRYIQGINIVVTIPFGEVVVFLMITPYINRPGKSIKKYLLGGFLIGAVTLLIIVFRDTAVLGNTLGYFALPSFETLRMVSVSQALSRMEILFAIVLIILLFFKVTFLYYVTVKGMAYLLKFKSYRPLVLITGAFIVTYALFLYASSVEHAASGREITPILWLLFEFVLPLSTLAIAKARKLPQKREEN